MSANTIIYHSHHIFPRHIDPKGVFDSYRINVTVEEHAEIHGLLFDEYWRIQDFWAWQTLTGQKGHEEIRLEALRKALKTPEERLKRSIRSKGNKNCLGRIVSKETRDKQRKSMLGRKYSAVHRQHISEGHKGIIPWHKGKKNVYSEEAKKAMGAKNLGKPGSFLGKTHSEKTKEKMRIAKLGHIPWNKGRKLK